MLIHALPEVVNSDNQTPTVPVYVDVAEIKRSNHGQCYCNRQLTVDEVKSLVLHMTGKEKIWEGIKESCPVEDKSFESLTNELNGMFSRYGIDRCMQKIVFLAQVSVETGFFKQSIEEKNNYKSSQSTYKGRGILQITGSKDATGYYNDSGAYSDYGSRIGKEQEITEKPDLLGSNLHYAIDVAGWVYSEYKKRPVWNGEREALKWKQEYFNLSSRGDSLNSLALLVEEEEEKYFYLISKLLNGYNVNHKLDKDPHGWTNRKDALKKLKNWFKYDKRVCDGALIMEQNIDSMPPWMVVAFEEYDNYKDYHSKESPLKERVYEYFDNSNYPNGTNTTNWCAAFVTWCLNKSTPVYLEPSGIGDVRARAFSPVGAYNDHYWEYGKETKEGKYAYGAIAVIEWAGSSGQHVAFIIGETSSGRIALLGGNQGYKRNNVRVGRGITKSSASKSEVKYVMYPWNFDDNDDLYELNEEDITDKLTHAETH